jgi:putative zinc finger/helix-turn-helix YgiT family protein
MTARREDHRYKECGLPHVTLIGIKIGRCSQCSNYEITIPHIEELHRLIAKALIEKPNRLSGSEVRFLRKSLGLSGSDFAKRIGVAQETVSRWENDAAAIGGSADRLLRFLVAQGRLTMTYPPEKLAGIKRKTTAARLRLQTTNEEWELLSA